MLQESYDKIQQQLTKERECEYEELKEHMRMLLAKKETEMKTHFEEELKEKERILQENNDKIQRQVREKGKCDDEQLKVHVHQKEREEIRMNTPRSNNC